MMTTPQIIPITREGELVQLVSPTNKSFILRLIPNEIFQTHRGVIAHNDLIGIEWGSIIRTHQGSDYILIQPSIADLLREIRRNTQILYPKDIGYILLYMGIGPGSTVVEAGSGSGALTTALAWSVGPQGRVYSYENRQENYNLARKNIEKVNLADRVTFKLKDISDGFDESNVDALFLDLPNPQDYLHHVRTTLKSGGHFGTILPTTNQVSKLLTAFYHERFLFPDVCEVLLRFYKPVPERLRPADRMVAHTGYLVFARPVTQSEAEFSIFNENDVREEE